MDHGWIAAASTAIGERLPLGGARWARAGDLLRRLAEPIPPRRGGASPDLRTGGPVEELRLTTDDGLTIAAWFMPASPRLPVLIHHHFGGTRADVLPVSRFLRMAGHPVLAIDGRSHGDSDAGRALGLALDQRPADVRAAMAWLRDAGFRGVHGFGFSMGAAVTMMGASHHGLLRSLVLDSGPVVHLFAACRGLIDHRLADAPPDRRLLAARRLYLDGRGWRYRRDLEDAAERLGAVPVLLLHGERDQVIPPSETDLLRRRVLRGPCERIVLPGTAHVAGWARHRLRYRDLVLDFLAGAERAHGGG